MDIRSHGLGWLLACLSIASPVVGAQPQPAGSKTANSATAVVNGPMVGAVYQRSARVWAQLSQMRDKKAVAWIDYQAIGSAGETIGTPKSSTKRELTPEQSSAIWVLEGLEPGTLYRYRVSWQQGRHRHASVAHELRTEALWQWRTDPPDARILASSCSYTNEPASDRPGTPYGQSAGIFTSMAKRQPDLTLWMGDNIYLREGDFDDRAAMRRRYDQWRSVPELAGLMNTGRHLATWDDHDYGVNDSNSSNPSKETSLELFKQYWANPSYGMPGLPGVFTQYRISDVEVFLLDARWYRDSDKTIDEDRRMFGDGQLRWLKNALLNSTATFKLVVSGSQMLNLKNRFEGWHNFPRESQDFLGWLDRQKVPGVMLLSGDRHFSVLLQQERSGNYPLYELTCSPTTARAYAYPEQDLKDNDRFVSGSVVTQNNFCELEVSGARGQRALKLSIADRDGNRLWETSFREDQLRPVTK